MQKEAVRSTSKGGGRRVRCKGKGQAIPHYIYQGSLKKSGERTAWGQTQITDGARSKMKKCLV